MPAAAITAAFEGIERVSLEGRKGAAWSSSCSRNAHAQKVLVRRAHLRINQAAPKRSGKTENQEKDAPDAIFARRTRTMKLCSFDAKFPLTAQRSCPMMR